MPGANGTFSTSNVAEVMGTPIDMCVAGGGNCDVGSSSATCPAGSAVLSGGWIGSSDPPVDATVGYNEEIGSTWAVIMANDSSFVTAGFTAFAICATPTHTSRDVRSAVASSATLKEIAQEVAVLRQQVASMR
jgi:hypothetical protein